MVLFLIALNIKADTHKIPAIIASVREMILARIVIFLSKIIKHDLTIASCYKNYGCEGLVSAFKPSSINSYLSTILETFPSLLIRICVG